MEERLNQQRSSGLSGRMLQIWGLAFLAVGAAGQAILQNKLLGIGSLSTQQLLEYAEYVGNYYGTPRKQLEEKLKKVLKTLVNLYVLLIFLKTENLL